MFDNEQIVATVPTLELANMLRRLLVKHKNSQGQKLIIFVFNNITIPNEYHLAISNEWQGDVSEDIVFELMEFITDFQEARLKDENEASGPFPGEKFMFDDFHKELNEGFLPDEIINERKRDIIE